MLYEEIQIRHKGKMVRTFEGRIDRVERWDRSHVGAGVGIAAFALRGMTDLTIGCKTCAPEFGSPVRLTATPGAPGSREGER